MLGGAHAVQLFYVISGFLMSLVLNENSSYHNTIKFYLNRILRIYPVYLSVAILSTIWLLIYDSDFIRVYQSIPSSAECLLIVSNFFIFGQDWVMFSGIEHSNLVFSTDFSKSEVFLFQGLVIPQAWTLGVELSFYLIAPFVLRSLRKIIALLVLSILLRIILVINGIGLHDPWTYRFFPLELALFLSGALAHRYILPFWNDFLRSNDHPKIILLGMVYLIVFIFFYGYVAIPEIIKFSLLFISFLFFLPIAFIYQNESKFDKKIGELSYPIYVGHMLVIWILGALSKKLEILDLHLIAIANLFGAVCFSFVLYYFVAMSLESSRSRIRSL